MVKCEQCDLELKEKEDVGEFNEYGGKFYVYKNKVVCEDCLLDMGVPQDEADPYERS